MARTRQPAQKSLPSKLLANKTIQKSGTGGVKNLYNHPEQHQSEGKLTLKIDKFSEFAHGPAHTKRESDHLFIQRIPWKVCAEKSKSAPDYMRISLCCMPENPNIPAWSCGATHTFKIMHQQQDGGFILSKIHSVFSAEHPNWGRPIIKFEELLHPENGWYDQKADTITIVADVNAKLPCGLGFDLSEQWHLIADNCVSKLLETNDATSVCTIECVFRPFSLFGSGDKKFYINKNILTSHSDAFRAMFANENTKESKESRVVIKDCTPKAVQQMLYYMQTGRLPLVFKAEDATELLKVANKYQVEPLALCSEELLIESLAVENVCRRLPLADWHNAHSLKIACAQLIRENFGEVKKQQGWAALKESHLKLLFDILEKLVE